MKYSYFSTEDSDQVQLFELFKQALFTDNETIINTITKIIRQGLDPNYMHHGITPLILALNHSEKVAKHIVELGADPNLKDNKDRTSVHRMAMAGRVNALELLLSLGGDVAAQDSHGQTPLLWAASTGNIESVLITLKYGASLDERDDNGNTALHHACWFGREELVKFLIHNNAIIDARNKGHAPNANYFLGEAAGQTPLMLTTYQGFPKIAKLLIQAGARVEARDLNGNTPLHIGVLSNTNNNQTLRELIYSKANIHAINKVGLSPLALSISDGILRNSANILLEFGADPHNKLLSGKMFIDEVLEEISHHKQHSGADTLLLNNIELALQHLTY